MLISFVYENMDNGYRIQWPDLTGREQGEWIARWEDSNRDYQRAAALTRGLRGTDIDALQTRAAVVAAMRNSPSLARRRPNNHVISEDDWAAAATEAGIPPALLL